MISTATSAPTAPTSGRAVANTPMKARRPRLRQRVIGGVGAEQAMHDLDQPPRQRRQLVIAELPFAAIGEGLDQVERQIGVETAPAAAVQTEKCSARKPAERGPRPALDPADESQLGRTRSDAGARAGSSTGLGVEADNCDIENIDSR